MKDIYDVIEQTPCHVCADGGEVEYYGDEFGSVWCMVCETSGPSVHCQTKREAVHKAYAAYMKMQGEVTECT
jgi:hypothetical protein